MKMGPQAHSEAVWPGKKVVQASSDWRETMAGTSVGAQVGGEHTKGGGTRPGETVDPDSEEERREMLWRAATAAREAAVAGPSGVTERKGGTSRPESGPRYSREAMVALEVADPKKVSPIDIIKAVESLLGAGSLLALCPKKLGEFELTLDSEASAQGTLCILRTGYMVSFLHLPAYISDEDIMANLRVWGMTILRPIQRRYFPGMKVRFPPSLLSLPYSVRFETLEGPQYFRVLHNWQQKLCRLCMRPGHVMKQCLEFVCRECCEHATYWGSSAVWALCCLTLPRKVPRLPKSPDRLRVSGPA
ncbi:uncharacterized protein [Hoplias malabaricus]